MTTIKIHWQNHHTFFWWNECCAWAIEQFGLPGDRYNTHAETEYMVFEFKNRKDAEFFALRWAN